jgi:hypothetical protein
MDIFGGEWEDYLEKIVKNWDEQISDDDLVLIAGDISWAMKFSDALEDIKYISKLKGKKVLIRGNHDYWWKSITAMREAFPPTVYAVQNDCLRFENILVSGTRGWTAPEGSVQSDEDKKIYLRETERLKLTLGAMSKQRQDDDKVIVMMHFPPFNSRREKNPVMQLLEDYRVDACVYGHLHGKKIRADKHTRIGGVDYYLTSCDVLENRLAEITYNG